MAQKKDDHRVLNRLGARRLTQEECEQVAGALIHTNPCTVVNGNMDGDCPVPIG
jgi:hypothetical protein